MITSIFECWGEHSPGRFSEALDRTTVVLYFDFSLQVKITALALEASANGAGLSSPGSEYWPDAPRRVLEHRCGAGWWQVQDGATPNSIR